MFYNVGKTFPPVISEILPCIDDIECTIEFLFLQENHTSLNQTSCNYPRGLQSDQN